MKVRLGKVLLRYYYKYCQRTIDIYPRTTKVDLCQCIINKFRTNWVLFSSSTNLRSINWVFSMAKFLLDCLLFYFSPSYLWKCCISRLWVDFINILHTNFLYERYFGSFFYIHVTREKLPKWHLYKKFVRKMLMKLTIGVNFTNVLQAALSGTDPKSAKRLDCLFGLLYLCL